MVFYDFRGFLIFPICLVIVWFCTCIIEVIPLLFLKQSKQWRKASYKCNIITNPVLNTVLLLISNLLNSTASLICIYTLGELIVIAVEAFLYRYILQEKLRKCVLISILVNVLSCAVGVVFAYYLDQAWNAPNTSAFL